MDGKLQTDRIVAIDLMRVMAILYIVAFWHLFIYTKAFPRFLNYGTFELANIMLGVFTLLSGYLIGLKETFRAKNAVLAYYKKRLLRIYPLYCIALVLFFILNISNAATVAKAALLVSMFDQPAPLTLWYITMIFSFYLISPVLIYAKGNIKKYCMICVTIVILLLIYGHMTTLMDFRILMYFPSFALGIAIASDKLAFKIKSPLLFILLAFSFILSLFISSSVHFKSWTITQLQDTPVVFTGSFLIFIVFMRFGKILPKLRSVEMLSYCSLCMYLFHRPVFVLFTGLSFPKAPPNQVIYLYGICLPVIVIFSWLTQRGYDYIWMRLTRPLNSV